MNELKSLKDSFSITSGSLRFFSNRSANIYDNYRNNSFLIRDVPVEDQRDDTGENRHWLGTRLFVARVGFLVFLTSIGAIVGSVTFTQFRLSEEVEFRKAVLESVFHLSGHFEEHIRLICGIGDLGTDILKNEIQTKDVVTTPYPGFRRQFSLLAQLTAINHISYSPILNSTNRQGWESDLLSSLKTDDNDNSNYPQSLQYGIWVWNALGQKSNNLTYDNKLEIFAPITQIASPNQKLNVSSDSFLYDIHSDAALRDTIDTVVVDKKPHITDFITGDSFQPSSGLHSTIYYPTTSTATSTVVGVLGVSFSWAELLSRTRLSPSTGGLVCVVASSSSAFSFLYTSDGFRFLGEFDAESNDYKAKNSAVVVLPSDSSAVPEFFSGYSLRVFASNEFRNRYISRKPLQRTITVVGMLGFACVVILLYACRLQNRVKMLLEGAVVARKEIEALTKRELDAKRSFVRYISHEIRNPLNIIELGLQQLSREASCLRAALSPATPKESPLGAPVSAVAAREGEGCLVGGSAVADVAAADVRVSRMLAVLGELEASADLAVEVLDDLLTFEKLSANLLQAQKTPVAVRDLLREAVQPLLLQAREGDIDLKLVLSDDVARFAHLVELDRRKIIQVVRKLTSNALKFTPARGVVEVRASIVDPRGVPPKDPSVKMFHRESSVRFFSTKTRAQKGDTGASTKSAGATPLRASGKKDPGESYCRDEPMLKIEVIDKGQGISEENQQRLFKEIVQFNPGELQDGKGSSLGLWISHQIVSLHGGRLSVHSNGLGHGCTFTMQLPLEITPRNLPNSPRNCYPGGPSMSPVSTMRPNSVRKYSVDNSDCSEIQPGSQPAPLSTGWYLDSVSDLASMVGMSVKSKPVFRGIGGGGTAKVATDSVVMSGVGLRIGEIDSDYHACRTAVGPSWSGRPLSPPSLQDRDGVEKGATGLQLVALESDLRPSRSSTRRPSQRLQPVDWNHGQCALASSARVLLVDDVPLNCRMMRRLLQPLWPEMLEAADGAAAVDSVRVAMVEGRAFDLILMDFEMPRMNGPEAAKLMREAGCTGIIIGVTGNALPADVQNFLASGADRVLLKPLRLHALFQCFEELVGVEADQLVNSTLRVKIDGSDYSCDEHIM